MKLQASTTTRSSRKRNPGAMRGPSISAAKRRGVTTTTVAGGPPPVAPDRPRPGEGAKDGLQLLESPIDAPRGAGSQRRRRHRRWRGQSTSWCGTPKGQGDGGPWGGAVRHAVQRCSNAQGTSGAGCPPGGNFRLVPAARRAPAAFSPRARGSGGSGGGRRVHCSGKCQRKK
jgi:hypothetical protein